MIYEVEAGLRTPLSISSPYLPLDSILQSLILQEEDADYFIFSKGKSEIKSPELPIKKYKDMYLCSCGLFNNTRLLMSYFSKRPNDSTFLKYYDQKKKNGKLREVSFKSGSYRSFIPKLAYLPINKITFLADVQEGNVEEFESLCKKITHLGKAIDMGWGEVAYIQIKESKDASAIVKNNKTLRSIPESYLEDIGIQYNKRDIGIGSYKAPYWHSKTKTKILLPFSELRACYADIVG